MTTQLKHKTLIVTKPELWREKITNNDDKDIDFKEESN